MEYNVDEYIQLGKDTMIKAIDHLKNELLKIRTGKASVNLLDGIMVEYYGSPVPISQVANLGTADARTITIQPWEKSMLAIIEQGIFAANLGLTPQNDGEFIRLNIPPLTEERRIELARQARHEGEEAKVSLRNSRHKVMDFIKNEIKDGYPEDIGKRKEKEVEDMIKTYVDSIDALM